MNSEGNISLFLQLFKGREDCFGQQGEGWYFPVEKPLDEFYLRRHLEGDATFGVYVLNRQSRCHLLCVDVDIPKAELEDINFADRAIKYDHLRIKLQAVLDTLHTQLGLPLDSILLEDTGGRGYHIWVFLSDSLDGNTAVLFGEILKRRLNFSIEFFPKQGSLTAKRQYGSLIKLPLGLHRKYGLRSVVFSLSDNRPVPIDGVTASLEHLASLAPVSPEVIAQAAQAFRAEIPVNDDAPPRPFGLGGGRPQFEGHPNMLLPQCHAIGNIRTKAERGEALSRSEAFHFADVMLSIPGGEDCIHETMRLSFRQDYDERRTQDEIERIKPLYPTSCSALVKQTICSGYCKDSVRKRNEDPLVPNTTPCSVWLQRARVTPAAPREHLLDRIAAPENLKQAFFQLKQYHEHEDFLFFDPFDYQHFERNLDANCEVIGKALIERIELPFSGYLPVSLPKKLNDALELQYRGMSYSTVYDQTPIQAVFNLVAPVIEKEFQSSSYGYRWNLETGDPYRIFEDWRKAYPRFRSEIMAALRRYPNGYHICCDIKGYYDHVDHEILLEQLRPVVPDTYIYQLIERVVRAYECDGKGGKGVPQGPAYARILANLYLNDFDVFAAQVTSAYFRYVDDFVLVFKSQKEAEQGLERLVKRLLDLGLELSQDEAKKPAIVANTDVTRVRNTLDKIQYGILEGTRHLQHLAPQAVADFGDALERHSVSPVSLEQLVRINDALPSLLYVVTQESLSPHPLRPKLCAIVGILIKQRWFCPKRLKNIFYRLLELESDPKTLRELFTSMEPAHKAYFILSVFGCWQSRGEHRELLKDLITTALTDANSFVWGFAVAIAATPGLGIDIGAQLANLLERLSQKEGYFGLIKWVATVNYLALPPNERMQLRKLVGPNSPDLLKMLLLSKLHTLPTMYVDGTYLRGILRNSGVLVLPAVSVLIAAATDESALFDDLLKSALSRLAFKPLVISLVTKEIFKRRGSAGLAEAENLKEFYGQVSDKELKQAMLNALSRIMNYGLACDEEFAKLHKEKDRYNECFFFERALGGANYDYLELIPEDRLREYMRCDLDSARGIVGDLSAKTILLPSAFGYDSGKHEIRLEFRNEARYRELGGQEFPRAPDSIRRALLLAAQAYKKAAYFLRLAGKVPPISVDNVLVDATESTLVFRTLGRSLSAQHIITGVTFGDQEPDIAKMVSIFLQDLLFKTRAEAKNFLDQTHHKGIDAFLAHCIRNMSAKEPAQRYSCSRFDYLVEQFTKAPGLSEPQICSLYLRERLKGALFRHNSEKVTWNGICRAVNDHLGEHLRVVCEPRVLHDAPFQNHLLLVGRGKRELHTLSRELLGLILNRRDLVDVKWADGPYCDLVECLLLYGIISVEVVSLGRVLDNKLALHRLFTAGFHTENRIRVEAGGYCAEFASEEIAALLIPEREGKTWEAIVGLSLQQLAVQALLACEVETGENRLTVRKPDAMSQEVFRRFAHACLVRVPQVEESAQRLLDAVFLALRSNEDFARPGGLGDIRNVVEILAEDLRRVRRSFDIKRRHGKADGRDFPPDIGCRSWFRRLRAKEQALLGCALTNSFPSSRDGYACSWDQQGPSMVNLVIPSERVNSLMADLRRGKLFGYKLRYMYSGRAMALWDLPLCVASGTIYAICELAKGSATVGGAAKGVAAVGASFSSVVMVMFAGKLLLYDIGYWASWHRRLVGALRKIWKAETEDSS